MIDELKSVLYIDFSCHSGWRLQYLSSTPLLSLSHWK